MRRIIVAGILLACAPALAPAQQAPANPPLRVANIDRGLTLARRMCGDCHAIERGRHNSPNAEAPAFQSIADTPGMSTTALRAFFNTPHRMMPNLIIERDDAGDLIDYLLSLRAK